MDKQEGLRAIKLDPKKKGTYTKFCKSIGEDSVTDKCITKGKDSKNPLTRKRATFADNAKEWN